MTTVVVAVVTTVVVVVTTVVVAEVAEVPKFFHHQLLAPTSTPTALRVGEEKCAPEAPLWPAPTEENLNKKIK